MSESDKSLLPQNLSQLERDLAGALSRISDIEIPIATLWDADKCPVELLPYLAWALRVNDWKSAWPEYVKRSVVRESLDVNRTKGTRGAVEKSLEAIRGDEVRLVEWFEDKENLAKGTFRVDVISTDTPVDGEDIQKIQPAINQAKNARSHLSSITVTSRIETDEQYSTLSRQALSLASGPWVVSSIMSSSSSFLGCVSRIGLHLRAGPLPLESQE